MKSWKFDLRVVERMLKAGEISEKDYQAFLRELPDLEGKYEETNLEELLPPQLLEKLMGKSEELDDGKADQGKKE